MHHERNAQPSLVSFVLFLLLVHKLLLAPGESHITGDGGNRHRLVFTLVDLERKARGARLRASQRETQ